MFIKSKIKYIRTALGPKTKEQIKDEIKTTNFNFPLTSLPCEHILHDISLYLQENKSIIDPKDKIELSNLSIIIKNPLIIYTNLYFESDDSKISNELYYTKKFNCNLICDVTNEKYHQNKKMMKKIQNISKINICFGQSLDYNKAKTDLKKYSNELQYSIVYGNDDEPENDKLIPGFIGEELIEEEFNSKKIEFQDKINLYKMIISDLVNKYEIPFFIKLQGKQKYKNTNTIVDFFNENNISNKRKILFILSLSDYDENNYDIEIKNLIEYILKNGYSIILTTYECDYSILNKSIEKKLNLYDQYYNKTKALFLNKIIKEFSDYTKQILLSNNINYRIQLKEYGGFGYNNLFENYYKAITEGLSEQNINEIFHDNLLNILCYWEPIEKFKKSTKIIKCENCQAEKEENDKELFSKYDKNFCSFKCLKEWLQKSPQ